MLPQFYSVGPHSLILVHNLQNHIEMKRVLPGILMLLMAVGAMAQDLEVVDVRAVSSTPMNPTDSSYEALRRGDKVEFDQYYTRASELTYYETDVKVQGQLVRFEPTGANPYYREVGNYFPFDGDARVLGARIAYYKHNKNEKDDTYDLSLYHVTEKGTDKIDAILAVKSFFGYEISVGAEKDSFTYIEFKSNDFTTVENGFAIMAATQDVTPFGDSTDDVGIYTSAMGDGRNESRAMVRVNPESVLYNSSQEYVRMDKLIRDPQDGFFIFDFDVIIIPVMDVEAGIGYINLKDATFNGHYPNPAKDRITIDLDVKDAQENFEISVQTMGGQVLKTINTGFMAEGKQLINVDISDLTPGNYVYTINSQNSTVTQILMVTE